MKALDRHTRCSRRDGCRRIPSARSTDRGEARSRCCPANVGVAQVFVPAAFAGASPAAIIVEPPSSPLRPGRPSVKVTIKHKTLYVPVALAAMTRRRGRHATRSPSGTVLTAEDVAIEHRALAGAPAPAAQVIGATLTKDLDAGTPLGAHDLVLPAPSPRGTHVTVDIAHGSLHIKGQGTLELAARVGEPATVRLAFNQTVVKGTLIAPGAVVVGDSAMKALLLARRLRSRAARATSRRITRSTARSRRRSSARAPRPRNGSLYAEGEGGLFEDPIAGRVGDILVIKIDEKDLASHQADTKLDKSDATTYGMPNALGFVAALTEEVSRRRSDEAVLVDDRPEVHRQGRGQSPGPGHRDPARARDRRAAAAATSSSRARRS